MANPIVVFGDSNGVGFGVSAGQDWPSLVAAAFGTTKSIIASSGHMAADQSWLTYGVTPAASKDYLVSIGTNDAQIYGADAVKMAAYVNFLRDIVLWCAAPSKVIARGGGVAYSGSWTDTSVNTIGKNTVASGATATVTVSGTAVYISYILQNHAPSEGVFEVRIDGVLYETITTNGTVVGNTQIGRSYAPAAIRIGGLSAGAHIVEIKSISAKTFFLEWVAGSDQPSKPRVFVANIAERSATGYGTSTNNDANVSAYGAAAFAMIDDLIADGLAVSKIDINSVFDPAIHLQADGIHYNPTGHIAVKDAIMAKISPTSIVSYPYRGGIVELEILAGIAQKVTFR
ncbi:hypothetical protein [Rhizobium sp. F40D2]|uniref:hypothetical protein n=1 Tax=Rhizobium sp. F40D2 TaxID=3453141 RepID=UPI003F23D37C